MDDQEKIDLILAWAAKHPEFDDRFVIAVQDKLNRLGILTERQSEALDNIIDKWGIE